MAEAQETHPQTAGRDADVMALELAPERRGESRNRLILHRSKEGRSLSAMPMAGCRLALCELGLNRTRTRTPAAGATSRVAHE